MTRRLITINLLVIAVAAVAAAGCGSSSSSKSKAAPVATTPPATTPAAPSTPSTGTSTSATPTNVMPSGISSSTPIDSPVVRNALIKRLSQISAIPASKDAPITDCIIKALRAKGINTYGDANGHLSNVKSSSETCTRQALLGQK